MLVEIKIIAIGAFVASGATGALAQHHDPSQPGHHQDHAAPPASKRIGDPYPFDTCPISGERLGSMGEPMVALYDGREVRFCCDGCPEQFEQGKESSWAKLDERIIKDQGPLYPLKTSVVSGKDLPAKPHEFVYGNRLVRVVDEAERSTFIHHAKEFMGKLDAAVIAAQGANYPLAACPVSGDKYGGEMGKPKDVVIAGRLVRLCCAGCKPDLEKDPAKYVAMVDEARKRTANPDQRSGEKPSRK